MSEKTVFISYTHDSDAHRERVLALSERLRADGIETILDQYLNGSPPQGWPRWMLDQFDAADSVLVVCTETYYRRFRGHEVSGKGKGADWEGALITQEIYDSRSRTLKFVPVFLTAADEQWIPEPLRPVSYYTLTSETAYQSLYDLLLEQGGVQPRPVGTRKTKPRRQGDVLTFTQAPHAEAVKIDVSRPRVYLAYTLRTPGLRERVLELADKLREQGIDSRMDLYHAKSLHGFTPPDPVPNRDSWDAWQEAEIRAADCVLIVCSKEFNESPRHSGAWRDVAFMKKNLKSDGVALRKFIPVGFDAYEVSASFIPAFIRGATYYDLTPGTGTGFGFDDLVRRFRTEFPRESAAATGEASEQAVDYYNRGLRSLSEGNHRDALKALNRVIELDPTMALAYYNRGLTHYLDNDQDLAIKDFDAALVLGFSEAILFRNRGNAFSRKGNVERALADYAQAIGLEPDNPLAYINRGEVYENTLQKESAIADYKAVLSLICEPQYQDKARARLLAMGVKVSASRSSPALDVWKEKLDFLQTEEARAADAEQKFSIQQRIKEARAKIRELEG